ncbi:hypothetical protein GJAV_G00190770 [Gymnothorax javanicus]|nr:hypothetical protein GJAV_G00190770 [Gymnothorax javanicus]
MLGSLICCEHILTAQKSAKEKQRMKGVEKEERGKEQECAQRWRVPALSLPRPSILGVCVSAPALLPDIEIGGATLSTSPRLACR